MRERDDRLAPAVSFRFIFEFFLSTSSRSLASAPSQPLGGMDPRHWRFFFLSYILQIFLSGQRYIFLSMFRFLHYDVMRTIYTGLALHANLSCGYREHSWSSCISRS